MDMNVYELALTTTAEKYEKYPGCCVALKNIDLTREELVYGKYLRVMHPIPGEILTTEEFAKNMLSMQYNSLYNQKHNPTRTQEMAQ